MRNAVPRASPQFVALAILICLSGSVAFAENIDPAGDGSRYAWSENLGWLNTRPGAVGGPGVHVADSGLTGWAWSENAGWISLSCTNRSCAWGSYGVTNDGCGTLAGFAWSENAGWINFAPAGAGVAIDPKTGIFSGRAWSENAGWITFSATSPVAYQVVTSWRSTAPPPAGSPRVTAGKTGGSLVLSWTALAGATTYDVVQGTLSTLRSSHGSFQSATQVCAGNDTPATSVTIVGTPGVGDGFWLLVRGGSCGGAGTYDSSAASQAGPRDAGIAASGNGCP